MSVWHVQGCRHTLNRCTPIDPSAREHFYTMSPWTWYYRVLLLHQVSLTCGSMQMDRCTSSTIDPSATEHYYTMSPQTWLYRALLHQVSLTCGSMQMDRCIPPIDPSATEHYYTMSPQTWWYRALLHQVSLTCGRMQMYPAEMYTPWLIKPSGTVPYYTRSKKTNKLKI